jgi:predicted phosphodiesterase
MFRLQAFIDSANQSKPNFIIQCGDFCYPETCPAIMAEWNKFDGPKYHVLGNHDMDKCDKAAIMKLWGMENRYYSFDCGEPGGGFHFVVLDRNCFHLQGDKKIQDYSHGNWGKAGPGNINCIDDEQLAWMVDDLEKTDKPTVVWIHQPLIATDGPNEIGNGQLIIDAFDVANFKAREKTGFPKVIACFFGHDHNDLYAERNGVHYVLLNSASYAYTSEGASFYQDPLFAFLTLDPAGQISIEGKATEYGPKQASEKVRMRIPPKISSRKLALPTA